MRLLVHVVVAWLTGNIVIFGAIVLEARARRRAADRRQRGTASTANVAPVIPLHPRRQPHLRPVAHR